MNILQTLTLETGRTVSLVYLDDELTCVFKLSTEDSEMGSTSALTLVSTEGWACPADDGELSDYDPVDVEKMGRSQGKSCIWACDVSFRDQFGITDDVQRACNQLLAQEYAKHS